MASGLAGHRKPAFRGRIHDCICTETLHEGFLLDSGGGSIHDQQYPGVFATAPFSHTTTHSDCIAGFGVLTVHCVRNIRYASSWRPASTDHR